MFFLGKIHGIGKRVDAKIRNVIGDLLGKRLEWERKKTTNERKKQHIKKQHNTHKTTIKNERRKKNYRRKAPFVNEKSKREKTIRTKQKEKTKQLRATTPPFKNKTKRTLR